MKLMPSNIDFLSRYNKSDKKSAKGAAGLVENKKKLMLIIPAVLIVCFAAYGIVTYVGIAKLKTQLYDIAQEAIELNLSERVFETEALRAQVMEQADTVAQLQAIKEYYLSWGKADAAAFLAIQTAARELSPAVEITTWTYSRDSYKFTLHGRSNSAINAANLVLKLKASGHFDGVGYFGFVQETQGGRFDFDIICMLKAVSKQ